MILDSHTHNAAAANAVVNVVAGNHSSVANHYYSMGVHPWKVAENNADVSFRALSEIVATDASVVAVGETGLDSLCGVDEALQMQSFERHIALSESVGKPLIIHCVRRSNEIIAAHRRLHPECRWMIHGFRGNVAIAQNLLKEGFYLSVGERFNVDAVRIIPRNRLLVETDESKLLITDIVERVAEARGEDAEELVKVLKENATSFFNVH